MKVNKNVLMITQLSVLVALEIVLSRFLSISLWNQKLGFSFVALAMAGMLYGPTGGAIVGGLSDFIGAILFPIGAYFPGFTLTNAIVGVIFGLFLNGKLIEKRKNKTLSLILYTDISVVLNLFFCTLLLNTMWISILYKTPLRELMATRLIQCLIMIPIEMIVLPMLYQLSKKIKKALRTSKKNNNKTTSL